MIEVTSLEIVFISVLIIQIAYWLVWLIGGLKIKKPTKNTSQHGVSVIIAANNELENLEKLLPLLLNQNFDLYEVIIIDDRSHDGSYEYLLEMASKHALIKMLTVNELPAHLDAKKYALTLGIKSAKYDQLLLTDADCKPNSEHWISSFANTWNDKTSFVLGFSSYEKRPGLLNYFIRFETIITGIQYLASAALGKPYMGVGRNLSYSKTQFLSTKGFHGFQGITGGDDDLLVNKYANGLNTKISLSPDSTMSSIPKSNISNFITQKTRHLSVGKHYSSKSKIILSVFALTWILSWGLLPFEILSTQNLYLPGSLLLCRYIFMASSLVMFSKRSGVKLNLLGLMLLDFMFVLYYFVTGLRAMLTKRVKWN